MTLAVIDWIIVGVLVISTLISIWRIAAGKMNPLNNRERTTWSLLPSSRST